MIAALLAGKAVAAFVVGGRPNDAAVVYPAVQAGVDVVITGIVTVAGVQSEGWGRLAGLLLGVIFLVATARDGCKLRRLVRARRSARTGHDELDMTR